VDKYNTARQATGNVTGSMRFAFWITNATNTLAIRNIYCFSKGNKDFTKVSQYDVYAY
jgi:hypothetical protein